MAPDRSTVPASWASWINVLLGVWLIIAPFALGYWAVPSPFWNDILLGFLILTAGCTAARSQAVAPSGWNVLFGLWLVAAPYFLRYGPGAAERAAINDSLVGLAVALLALTVVITKTAAGGRRAMGA